MGMSREQYEVMKAVRAGKSLARERFLDQIRNRGLSSTEEPTVEEIKLYSGMDVPEEGRERRIFGGHHRRPQTHVNFYDEQGPDYWNGFAPEMPDLSGLAEAVDSPPVAPWAGISRQPIYYSMPFVPYEPGGYTFKFDLYLASPDPPKPPPPRKFEGYAELAASREPRPYRPDLEPEPTRSGSLQAPDYTCYLTGYRAWNLLQDRLTSLGQNGLWPVKSAMEASCYEEENHPCPDAGCACGLWAFKTLEGLIEALQNYRDEPEKVIGTVALWGNVVETEHGWRAQYAYPLEIWIREESQEKVAAIYGCDVRDAINRPARWPDWMPRLSVALPAGKES